MKELYLSHKIIYQPLFLTGGAVSDQSKLLRAYEIWERANLFVLKAENEFDLSDSILNLKRSLNQRLKLIEEMYSFNEKKFEDKQKGYLDLLAYLGIIRPFLLKKLIDVRNGIEHKDKKVPKKIKCMEFLDIVWYFLKSTDSLVSTKRESIETVDQIYGYDMFIDWKSNKIAIRGWFPAKFMSERPKENFFKIDVKTKETKKDFKQDKKNYEDHKDKLIDDVWLIGNIIFTPKELTQICKVILNIPQ